ncbi:hypothetical protein [Streptomyces fractus]|uniref:hypothetical protein n=1 Tax=Streptomyces fractus TaxID=641806 RepID=UPI003CEAFD39
MQELASAGPWAIVAVISLVIIVICGGILMLRVGLRDTSEASRPDTIRALADYFRALWGRK